MHTSVNLMYKRDALFVLVTGALFVSATGALFVSVTGALFMSDSIVSLSVADS